MPRNSSGTYSLPAGNPVVSGTLIETNWANPTMSDLGTALTDSLDRFGRGGMLAQLKLADGTLAAPAFAFNSEASTGLFRPGASSLAISALGSLVATFTNTAITFAKATTFSAGVTLSAALAIFGGTAALPGLAIAGDLDTGIYSDTANTLGISTQGVVRLLVNPAGFIGIGVTPVASVPLMVHTAANRNVAMFDQGSAATVTALTDAGSSAALRVVGNPLTFSGNGTADHVFLTNTGQLGIGGAPDARLTVVSGDVHLNSAAATDAQVQVNRTTVAATAFGLNASVSTNAFGAVAGTAYVGVAAGSSNPALVFTTGSAERVRIDNAGRVGIGRTPTSNQLEVAGPVGIVVASSASDIGYSASMTGVLAWALGFNNTAGTNVFGAPAGTVYFGAQAAAMVFTTSSTERMRIDAAGRVGIGRTPVSLPLEVQGVTKAFGASNAPDIGFSAEATGVIDVRMGVNNSAGNNIYGAPAGTVFLGTSQGSALVFTNSGIERARFDTSGHFVPGATATYTLGDASHVWNIAYATQLQAPGGAGLLLNASNATGVVTVRTNGADRFGFASDGRIFGTALHNNAGTLTGTTTQYIASGTYGATFTPVTNVASITNATNLKWTRVGNVMSACGQVTVTPTAAATNTQFTITLPIASSIGGVLGALAGTIVGRDGGTSTITSGRLTQDPANPIALVIMTPPTNVAFICSYTFMYEIL